MLNKSKIFKFTITLIISVFLINVTVFAEEYTVYSNINKNSNKIEYSMSFSKDINLAAMNFDIEFNPEVVKPIVNEKKEVVNKGESLKEGLFVENTNISENMIRGVFVTTSPVNDTKFFIKVNFEIINDNLIDENVINLKVNEMFNNDKNAVNYVINKTFNKNSILPFNLDLNLILIIISSIVGLIIIYFIFKVIRKKHLNKKEKLNEENIQYTKEQKNETDDNSHQASDFNEYESNFKDEQVNIIEEEKIESTDIQCESLESIENNNILIEDAQENKIEQQEQKEIYNEEIKVFQSTNHINQIEEIEKEDSTTKDESESVEKNIIKENISNIDSNKSSINLRNIKDFTDQL